MRVLLVSPSMDAGGAERIAVELAHALCDAGHDVCFAAPPGPRDAELPAAGIDRVAFRDRGRSLSGVALPALRIAAAVRRFRPDVVHAHSPRVTAAAAAAARLGAPRARPPVISTFHGTVRATDRRIARLLRTADTVVAVSAELGDRLRDAGLVPGRVAVVPNAVPALAPPTPERRQQIDAELGLDGAPVVTVVGRIVREKGHARFMQAVRTIGAEVPAARFLVVGDGPLRPDVERLAASLGIDGRVRFTGLRRDARDLIARSDVLVVPSDSEGLSLAALEALSAGVPVVSTPAGGMSELFAEGGGVELPDRSPERLAEAVVALLRDPGRRVAMGSAGARAVGQRFSHAAMLEAYLELYARSSGARC